jgi:hypothetical protein
VRHRSTADLANAAASHLTGNVEPTLTAAVAPALRRLSPPP